MSKGSMNTKRYWRSLDDLGKTPKFERTLHREFKAQEADEVELDGMSRRSFVGLMGASTALAGAGLTGCVRKPAQYILPYAERPEDLIPGKARMFATAVQVGDHVQGVLVESQDGRPTKIEGNPGHPASIGRTSAMVQAVVLDVYDQDRSRGAIVNGTPTSVADAMNALPSLDAQTAILVDGTASPTLSALLGRAARSGAKVYRDGADVRANEAAGLAMVGGANLRPYFQTKLAKVIVAIDSDLLASGPNCVANAAGFAEGRSPENGEMNRLYAIEPAFSPTGATADNRYQLPASQIGTFVKALSRAVLAGGANAPGSAALAAELNATIDEPRFAQWVSAVSADLLANRGRSVVSVGERQPAWVHGLVAMLNQALGNVGTTVDYRPDPVAAGGTLRELVAAIDGGQVTKLVVLGGNPVYSAPGDLDLAAKIGGLASSVHLGYCYDETARACKTHIPASHALEAWGDLVSADGTAAIVQPLIEPLFDSRSAIEVAGKLIGANESSSLDLVRQQWKTTSGAAGDRFERKWREWLHSGVVEQDIRPVAAQWNFGGIAGQTGTATPMPTTSSLEAVFALDNKLFDGRFANNTWLQELPDPISKITWDNGALLNPVTARALGIDFTDASEPTDGDRFEEDSYIPSTLHGGLHAPMVTVTVNGQSMELPAIVVPGVAENTIYLPIGYGRDFGTAAKGVGFASHKLRTAAGEWIASGATLAKSRGTYPIATTQDHGSMEGRPLIREATVTEYNENPAFVDDMELMPKESLYSLWDVDHLASHGEAGEGHAAEGRDPGQQYWETDPQQWGMSIDLSSCTGCNACTVACQAENNISVVGKERVLEGREMHWIRLDRYFSGDPGNPEVAMQPVACMHCENAPCEQVCPVAATTHGPQGTNDMAYNRCIGTRYCANNCPYKVRRFNFFNFARENDERNPLVRMQKNPDVTVRFRGVMEKCTYCIQRVNAARIDAKVKRPDGIVQDGTIMTACEQACPSGAIVFGNVADPQSRVSQLRARDRDYALLSWVNSHPRTTYLAKISNPNPELA